MADTNPVPIGNVTDVIVDRDPVQTDGIIDHALFFNTTGWGEDEQNALKAFMATAHTSLYFVATRQPHHNPLEPDGVPGEGEPQPAQPQPGPDGEPPEDGEPPDDGN